MPPAGIGYPQGKPSAFKWKKEPRPDGSASSATENTYGTGREGQSMGRMGPGGDGPTSKESSPALNNDPGFARNVKYPFDSNPDKGDAMPRKGAKG